MASKQVDLAGIFLRMVLSAHLDTTLLASLAVAGREMADRIEELEGEGRELLLVLGALIVRAGGTVEVEDRELEALDQHYIQRRRGLTNGATRYRVLTGTPVDRT